MKQVNRANKTTVLFICVSWVCIHMVHEPRVQKEKKGGGGVAHHLDWENDLFGISYSIIIR